MLTKYKLFAIPGKKKKKMSNREGWLKATVLEMGDF